MLGLRLKFSLGLGGLLIIILMIGVQSVLHLSRLGESIDVILRENYRSVVACQEMKEALERMDSGALFTLLGYTKEGEDLIRGNELAFEKSLRAELNNITVAGESERAARLEYLFKRYRIILRDTADPSLEDGFRRNTYFVHLLPLFLQIKNTADEILQMNQQNMVEANNSARWLAKADRSQMYLFLISGIVVAVGFVLLTRRWIYRPINRLIRSADEIRRGNLDLVVRSDARDEIGRLSEAFNTMAAGLREFRRSDQARLVRIRRATQQAFSSLPDAVAVIDLEGRVEIATEMARDAFSLKPGLSVFDLPFEWMADLFGEALRRERPAPPKDDQRVIQHFVEGKERYFRPEAVPILDNERLPTGVILVLQDVTQLRQQNEIKRGVISTVSHQLKTPLTSMRMAIYLLLEEKVGPLTEKQGELLLAAREDSDRLNIILNNLLDISRIESGKAQIALRAVPPRAMALEALESFRRAAQDQGVTLSVELPDNLPDVLADMSRMTCVFNNLLSNGLKYTPAGGKVTLSAEADERWIRFSVADTGKGIPDMYLPRIFEQFFRVPGQDNEAGAGLGLAIVKEIVEAHGGRVNVESREGMGSTFSFTLQRADRAAEEGGVHE